MDPLLTLIESMRLNNSHHEAENARMDRHLHRRRSSALANIEGELFDEQAKNIKLKGQVRELKAQLERAKAVARDLLLESDGRFAAARSIYYKMNEGEALTVEQAKAIVGQEVERESADPTAIEKAEQYIARKVTPAK